MKLGKQIAILSSIIAVTACGKKDKSSHDQAQDASPSEEPAPSKAEKPADLPIAAIVRVPVGADGKEDPTKAELRLDGGQALAQSEEEAISSFEQGKKPPEVKGSRDELDKTSSTQSWFLGCLFKNYNYSYNYGYNYSVGYGNYNNYSNYSNPTYYGNGGYNYYYYPYSGGYGNNYGGGYGGGYGNNYGGGYGNNYGGGYGNNYGGGYGGGYGNNYGGGIGY